MIEEIWEDNAPGTSIGLREVFEKVNELVCIINEQQKRIEDLEKDVSDLDYRHEQEDTHRRERFE